MHQRSVKVPNAAGEGLDIEPGQVVYRGLFARTSPRHDGTLMLDRHKAPLSRQSVQRSPRGGRGRAKLAGELFGTDRRFALQEKRDEALTEFRGSHSVRPV